MNRITGLEKSLALTQNILIESVTYAQGTYTCHVKHNYNTTLDIVEGDVLRCESGISGDYYGIVSAVNDDFSIVINESTIVGESKPNEGDLLLRFGHISNKDRQGVLYLTQDEYNSPCLVVYDGVTDGSLRAKELVKIGNLGGIIDPNFGTLVGSGAYIKNGYVNAQIYAKEGSNVYTKYEIDNILFDLKQLISDSVSGIDLTDNVNLTPLTDLLKQANSRASQALDTLTNILSDNVFTPSEKSTVLREWEKIKAEKPITLSQIGKYNINYDKYNAAYEALRAYIVPLLAKSTENSPVDRDEFRNKFQDYYVQYAKLLSSASDQSYKISNSAFLSAGEAKKAADDASAKAVTMLSFVNNISDDGVVTIKEKNDLKDKLVEIDSEYNKLAEKCNFYYTPAELADTTGLWYNFNELHVELHAYLDPLIAEDGDSTIDRQRFTDQFTTYLTSRGQLENVLVKLTKDQADQAVQTLTDMSSDNVLTPQEKPTILRDWLEIREQYPIIKARATLYDDIPVVQVRISDYDNSFISLQNYLANIINDGGLLTGSMTASSNIVSIEFNQFFKDYYTAKDTLLNEIEIQSKGIIDNLQVNATFITLTGDQTFVFTDPNTPDKTTITLTATEHNFVGSASDRRWEYTDSTGTWQPIPNTFNILTYTLRYDAPIFESRQSITIRFRVQELEDRMTIVKLYSGTSNVDIVIRSDFGDHFFNGNIDTILRCFVYYGGENVTDRLPDSAFKWSRISDDPIADNIWNQNEGVGTKLINITGTDVFRKAVFDCDVDGEI